MSKKIRLDEDSARVIIERAAALVIKQLITDKKIRLDSYQLDSLAQAASKSIKVNINYDKIKNEVLELIPVPRDGKDLVMTEAIREDMIQSVAQLVPAGKDGSPGLPGKDGRDGLNYTLTAQDRADIAEKSQPVFPTADELKDQIIEGIVNAFVSKELFNRSMRQINEALRQSPSGKKLMNAGISGAEMIEAINRVLSLSLENIIGAIDLQNIATGFPNRTDSTISFVNGTRTFTIQPTGDEFTYYLAGQPFVVSSADSIVISDVEGVHYIYYDVDGVLKETTTFDIELIYSKGFVSIIYWDVTNSKQIYFAEERHGFMDTETHLHFHNSIGALLQSKNDFGLTNINADASGGLNASAQFGVNPGTLADEDIKLSLAAIASTTGLPVYYRLGASAWRVKEVDGYSLIYSGDASGYTGANNRAAYNQFTGGAWQLTQIGLNNFVGIIVYAANAVENNRGLVAVLGQEEYTTLPNARDGILSLANNLDRGNLPFVEFSPIAGLIFQTSGIYGNTPKARIRSTQNPLTGDNEDYLDLRSSLSVGTGQSQQSAIEIGTRRGFEVKPNTTTTIKIGTGYYEGNGALYELSSEHTHTMTSLVVAYDQHYIYIDHDASTPPVPVFYDSTTEPVWNHAKDGWYNGDDVLVFGAVPSKPAAAEIEYFFTYYLSDRCCRVVIGSDNWMILNGISLTGNWQDPTTAASVYLPVNAKEALIKMYNTDGLANVKLSWLNNEAAALNPNIFHSKNRINIYNEALYSAWGGLGTSRNIKVGGDSSNDNVMQVFVGGWGGKR